MSIQNSPVTLTLTEAYIAFQVVSALVQSLPAPSENPTKTGGILYKIFYNFVSILVADFKSFMQSKTGVPQEVQPQGVGTVNKPTPQTTPNLD